MEIDRDVNHPEIPDGDYCYTGQGIEYDEDGKPRLKLIPCPHWQATENGARCNLLNEEHHEYCPWHLVWDRVKECGINKERRRGKPTVLEGEEYTKICDCGREVRIIHVKRKS